VNADPPTTSKVNVEGERNYSEETEIMHSEVSTLTISHHKKSRERAGRIEVRGSREKPYPPDNEKRGHDPAATGVS